MSDKSGSTRPRENLGRVFSLILIGLLLYTGLLLIILPNLGVIDQVTVDDIATILKLNSEPAEDVAGSSTVEEEREEVREPYVREEAPEVEEVRDYSPSEVFDVNLEEEQNDTIVTLSEVEMKGDLLIASFTIKNNSDYTLYFPFYGTNASFDGNGGAMFRELYSKGDAGYDQFPTIIDPQTEVTGKIAYTPLLYQDKPFTIYIRNLTYREIELDWESYQFYVDLGEEEEI